MSASTKQDVVLHAVDVNDSRYQKDPLHKPDKESTWDHAPEQSGWFIAHNSIRAELADMRKSAQAIAHRRRATLDTWEVESIRSWCAGHFEHVHGHHINEDDILNPFLRTRIQYPPKLETDHKGLVEMSKRITKLIETDGFKIQDFLELWTEYEDLMRSHLIEEELIGLPLMRAYFTPLEMKDTLKMIGRRSGGLESGSIFHHLGYEKTFEFLAQEGLPSIVYYLVIYWRVRSYRKAMQSLVDSLFHGTLLISTADPAEQPKKPDVLEEANVSRMYSG